MRVAVLGLVMLAGCVRAGALPASPGPSRDEVRAAIYAAEYGLKTAFDSCVMQVGTLLESERFAESSELTRACEESYNDARKGVGEALRELEDWRPGSDARAGCEMAATVHAYSEMLPRLEALGFVLSAGDDGEARAKWLSARCRP